jgi:hypothetical protein
MHDPVYLRAYQLNKHYQTDLLSYFWFHLETIRTESDNFEVMLFQATIDQFLVCCIYSGLFLKSTKLPNFNDILSIYNELMIK